MCWADLFVMGSYADDVALFGLGSSGIFMCINSCHCVGVDSCPRCLFNCVFLNRLFRK